MKCKNCGFEYNGIFCPECGTRNLEEYEKTEKAKTEENRIEYERLLKEKAEAEAKAVQEKAIIEKAEKEKLELEARTYKKVVYKNEAEAKLAREDDDKIEILKQQLLTTNKQVERQKILSEFREDITTAEAKKRLNLLSVKVNQKKPKSIMYNWIYGGTIILALLFTMIIGTISKVDGVWEIIIVFLALWYGIGIPVWIVWKIILAVKSKSKDYYLNLKNI